PARPDRAAHLDGRQAQAGAQAHHIRRSRAARSVQPCRPPRAALPLPLHPGRARDAGRGAEAHLPRLTRQVSQDGSMEFLANIPLSEILWLATGLLAAGAATGILAGVFGVG